MAVTMVERGYFSVIRWRSNPTRDEARNIAVVLVDAEGQFGGIRPAPPSALSSDSRQQGFLDAILHGIEAQFSSVQRPDLAQLRRISDALTQSLYLTPPRAVAVPDPDLTLQALYKAYVAPIGAPRSLTKGVVTDRVVASLRKQGYKVHRSEYLGDFIFDAVIAATSKPLVCSVLSFATTKKNAAPIERDAGHFLYGVEKLKLSAMAVVEPPASSPSDDVLRSFDRVHRWFEEANISVSDSAHVEVPSLAGAGR